MLASKVDGKFVTPKHKVTVKAGEEQIVVKVQLPLLGASAMAGVDLEVTANRLELSALENEEAPYYLDLPLPKPVDADSVGAKFSKKKKTLTVTLSTDLWRTN